MGGIYRAQFVRGAEDWRIEKLSLDVCWSRGNPDTFELAAQNASRADQA